MSPARPLHRCAVATLAALAVGVLAAVGTSGASTAAAPAPTAAPAAAAGQKATITVLPPISQPGKKPAKAKKAKIVVSAGITPAKKNRPATLLKKAGGGWKSAGQTKTTKAGYAEFSVPAGKAVYKVSAARYKGLAPITTKQVSTKTWGKADFTDEFSGSTLGPDWTQRAQFYNPGGLRNCAKGDPAATSVSGGLLRLSVLADPARATESCTAYRADGSTIGQFRYRLNGHISTDGNHDFKYGVAAARMKFQKARGQHASFWLQPSTFNEHGTSAAKDGAEVDIIEWFGSGGKQSGLTSFIYEPTPKGPVKVGGFLKQQDRFLDSKKDSWWTQYHVFSVEWTKKAYVFRIDGRETTRITTGISGVPEYPILSLLSSDYELEDLGNENLLPQHTYIDWIQTWEAK